MGIVVTNKKRVTVIIDGKLSRKAIEFLCQPAANDGCWDKYAPRYEG